MRDFIIGGILGFVIGGAIGTIVGMVGLAAVQEEEELLRKNEREAEGLTDDLRRQAAEKWGKDAWASDKEV